MREMTNKKFFYFSLGTHGVILLLWIISFDWTMAPYVVQNSSRKELISAVVLGDIKESKILTPSTLPSLTETKTAAKKTAPLTVAKETKVATKTAKAVIEKDLLNDIKKVTENQKKLKQKQVKNQLQKLLHEQAEKSLRQELVAEKIKLTAQQIKETAGIVDKYKALILQAISEHWIVPIQANRKLYCELMIRLTKDGTVVAVEITKSSGDKALDNSARAAVLKASPLPVPEEPSAFAPFKQFVLKVKPENIETLSSR